MRSPRAKSLGAVTAIVASLAIASSAALAYILPADAILSSTARRREQLGFKSLVISGLHRRGTAGTAEERVWEAILPDVGHRVELRGPDGVATVILTVGNRRWIFKEGERAQPVKIRPSLIIAFLGNTERAEAKQFTSAYGINDDVVSLSRLDHQAAYVIGAKPWEQNKPQLWIDKNFRVPVRLIEIDPSTKELKDTRLVGFGSAMTGEWWPRQIQIFKNSELVETYTYTEVKVNEPLDPALFKPPQ